jgi:hypothetical protein
LQLVVTGQAEQVGCPLTGKPVNSEASLQIAGTEVKFCCNGCKGKAAKLDPAGQIQLVFGKGFDKGFKVKSN